jgi:hypothetical protein
MDSEWEVCRLAVVGVLLCWRFNDSARPIDPDPDAFRTLPILLIGRSMIEVSSGLGILLAGTVGEISWSMAGSVDVILLWKSSKFIDVRRSPSKSNDAFFSNSQGFEFSGLMDAKLKRDMLLIGSCRSCRS